MQGIRRIGWRNRLCIPDPTRFWGWVSWVFRTRFIYDNYSCSNFPQERQTLTMVTSLSGLIFAPEDTDEIITKVGLPPRERLLQSIEQHCELRHLQMIVAENQMDLKLSGNALLLKAAASCNIEAFLWLVMIVWPFLSHFLSELFWFLCRSIVLSVSIHFTRLPLEISTLTSAGGPKRDQYFTALSLEHRRLANQTKQRQNFSGGYLKYSRWKHSQKLWKIWMPNTF